MFSDFGKNVSRMYHETTNVSRMYHEIYVIFKRQSPLFSAHFPKMSIRRHLDLTSAAALRAAAVKVSEARGARALRLISLPLRAFRTPLTRL